ncbi:hypothetical protein LguiB_010638 [Lonicera macranthoides]
MDCGIENMGLIVLSFLVFLKFFKLRRIESITTTAAASGTTSAPAPAPASSASVADYDVFLSFPGEDSRNGFIDFLRTCLVDAGTRLLEGGRYEDLLVGEKIDPSLSEAIKGCKISIPIFSKNYASSKWCLHDLAYMVECHRTEGQMIFPIFYNVDPSDVRHQRGSYEEAFRRHKKNLEEKTVQRWKEALRKVAELKGWGINKEADGGESKLVKIVVEKVLLELKNNYMDLPKNLVGMDHHVAQMEGLLDANSNGVRVVVIHGMGGIGKTTIAKVIYNKLRQYFECCSFLHDVRAKSKDYNGLVNLQIQLICDIQKRQFCNIVNVDDGIVKVKDAVRGKKVLIVLDNVDEKRQFDMLAGKFNWYGVGSKIIVTTRYEEVLNMLEFMCKRYGLLEACCSYKPPLMDFPNSLQLFSKYAFISNVPSKGYEVLSEKAVSIAAGVPLVLVTIGSSLFGEKDKDLWEEKLKKLEETPHEEVSEKLRISFEALNDKQKQIFLDISCLFIGENKIYPSYMWDECQFDPTDGINALVLKSMIKVGDDNRLWMHDHLRDLGRLIVRKENFSEPWKRSRLWHHEEAFDLLVGHKGSEKVVALNLDFVGGAQESCPNCLLGKDFERLQNLRFLRVGHVDLDGDFKHLLQNLIWLKWAPLGNFAPINCHLKNLVILDLSYSQITDDWKGWSQIKMAKKMKVLNLSHCYSLTRTTHISMFASLERLILSSCFRLDEIDPSFGNLINLRALDLSNCLVLNGTLDCSMFANLESLDVHSCTRLSGLCGLEKLESLRNLNTSDCQNLFRFDLSNLKLLRKLDTSGCVHLIEIHGLGELEYLEHLNMSGCISIERLPDIANLGMLEDFNIAKCDKLLWVEGLRDLESLETLDMSWCTALESIPNLSNLKYLKKLKIGGFKDLKEILGLEEVKSLELLDISGWKSIEKSPDLSNLKHLREIYASRCVKLTEIKGLEELRSLELLDISGCKSVEKLPDLSNLNKLKVIKASGCVKLSEIRGLEKLESLMLLDLSGCKALGNLSNLPNTRIEELY